MKLVPTADQLELTAMLRELFSDTCPPDVPRRYKEPGADQFPDHLWATLGKTGLFGLAAPGEAGGDDATLFELGLFFYEAGRVLCPSIVQSTLLFRLALQRLAHEGVASQFLPRVIDGHLRASLALWNPADASDVSPSLVATLDGGAWTLSGALSFVTDARHSDVVMVSARVAHLDPGTVYAFLVMPGGEAWQATQHATMAGGTASRVDLEDFQVGDVPPLTGPDGRGLTEHDLHWVANAATALGCMEMAGGASAVLARTADYLKVREQFGRPIGSFQAAQHQVANMRIASDGAYLTACQATWLVGEGSLATREVAIAKMKCSEAYKTNTLTAHQLHGGMGFVRETDLHLWSERAKTLEVLGGHADVAATWLERELELTPRHPDPSPRPPMVEAPRLAQAAQ